MIKPIVSNQDTGSRQTQETLKNGPFSSRVAWGLVALCAAMALTGQSGVAVPVAAGGPAALLPLVFLLGWVCAVRKTRLLWSFPYCCPEPVLAK
jgi:hypothetical protein